MIHFIIRLAFYLRFERILLRWSNINNWGCTQHYSCTSCIHCVCI